MIPSSRDYKNSLIDAQLQGDMEEGWDPFEATEPEDHYAWAWEDDEEAEPAVGEVEDPFDDAA